MEKIKHKYDIKHIYIYIQYIYIYIQYIYIYIYILYIYKDIQCVCLSLSPSQIRAWLCCME